ncbi:putative coiled-coil domain-containing protein 195 [Gastrophryne carolinensis]
MEGDTQLLCLIREMRSEINKLEKENKELRGELSQSGHKTLSVQDEEITTGLKCSLQQGEKEVACQGLMRRNESVGSTNTLQEQTGAKMTVRRYSMSSLISGSGYCMQGLYIKRYASSGTLNINRPTQDKMSDNERQLGKEAAEEIVPQHFGNSIPKTRSFQEHMHKCRGKVKTVTFMLPTHMTNYTEKPMTFQNLPNQSTNHLSTITEKDP